MVELEIDEDIGARTSLGDSWVNPAERRMDDLNIACEAAEFAVISTVESDHVPKDHAKWFEKPVRYVGSMSAIRKLVHGSIKTPNGRRVCTFRPRPCRRARRWGKQNTR